MDTVTYPDDRVTGFVGEQFIPLEVSLKENRELAEDYLVNWTPNVVVTDEEGASHYRVEGFLPPADFMGRLALGLGRYWLDHEQFDKAIERLEGVARRHAGTDIGAEALYWLGVTQYKKTKDPAQLRPSWERLMKEYPGSERARSADIPATS